MSLAGGDELSCKYLHTPNRVQEIHTPVSVAINEVTVTTSDDTAIGVDGVVAAASNVRKGASGRVGCSASHHGVVTVCCVG